MQLCCMVMQSYWNIEDNITTTYNSFYGVFPKELPQAMNHHAALLHGNAIVLEHRRQHHDHIQFLLWVLPQGIAAGNESPCSSAAW
jgi:hypothetical protein